MLKSSVIAAAMCLGALVLSACGGDDLVKVAPVPPTVSSDALLDFGSSPIPAVATPITVQAPPSPASVPPAATSRPSDPSPTQAQTQPQSVQALPPTSTPLPAVPTNPPATATVALGGNCPASASGGAPGQVFTYGAPPGGGNPGNSQGVIGPGGGGPVMVFGGNDALASFLGTASATVQTELAQPGATQASVAAKHGKTRDQLKAFLIEQNRKLAADQVSQGRMTQAQAQQFAGQYAANVDKIIDQGSGTFGAGSGITSGANGGPGGNATCLAPVPGR